MQSTASLLHLLIRFYADPEARCQVFHVCGLGSASRPQQSFLCPNGTVFNSLVKTCDWWNNVQCWDELTSQNELQTLPSGETTRYSQEVQAVANPSYQDRGRTNLDSFALHDQESEVKINFNRSKLLLDAFKTREDTTENPANYSPNIFTTLTGAGYFDDRDISAGKISTVKEVSIKPRVKYTHSVIPSSIRNPDQRVKSYFDPRKNSESELEGNSHQNKYITTEKSSLKTPVRFIYNNEGTDSGDHNETDLAVTSKSDDKQHEINLSSGKITHKIEKNLSSKGVVYSDKATPLKLDSVYFGQGSTENYNTVFEKKPQQTVERSNLANRLSSKPPQHKMSAEISSSQQMVEVDESYETSDRRVTINDFVNSYDTTVNEAALIKKLTGENKVLHRFSNQSKQDYTNDVGWPFLSTIEQYLTQNERDKQTNLGKESTSTILVTHKSPVGDFDENNKKNLPKLDHIPSSTDVPFVFDLLDKLLHKYGPKKSDDVVNINLKSSTKYDDKKLQSFTVQSIVENEKPFNEELDQDFSVFPHSLEYKKPTVPIDEYTKISTEPAIPSDNSYVSVSKFSSFPELFTSPISGYYVTELAPGPNHLTPNVDNNSNENVNDRTTRLDEESYKLENDRKINNELTVSESKNEYPATNPKDSDENNGNQYQNVERNVNIPSTNERDYSKILRNTTLSEEYTDNVYAPLLGPSLAFENSHLAWPISPPSSIFYSPYPILKSSTDQNDATQALTFFPHTSRRTKVESSKEYNKLKNASKSEDDSLSLSYFPQALQRFLSRPANDEEIGNLDSSFISVQPTIQVYSESTTSVPYEDKISKLSSIEPFPYSQESRKSNDSQTLSAAPTTENTYFIDAIVTDDSIKESNSDGIVLLNHKNSRRFNDQMKAVVESPKQHESPVNLNAKIILTERENGFKNFLEPPDLLKINNLQKSDSSTGESFTNAEVVKSLSFDLDSPEDREQLKVARSKGLFKR